MHSDQRLDGFYRGKVVQHGEMGRCRVWIPGVFPNEFNDDPKSIPWAEQAMSLFGGGNSGNGSFSYPGIGVAVWCFFANGDQNHPVYFALSLGGDVATETKGKGFDGVRANAVQDDEKSEDTTLNGQDAQQHGFTIGDCSILMRESGQVDIEAKDPNDSSIAAKIQVTKDGIVTITASENIILDGKKVILQGDQIEITCDKLKMTATKEGSVQSQDLTLIGNNTLTGLSPSINMDATSGKFIAKGSTGLPLFAT